jgi:hypothetical protein
MNGTSIDELSAHGKQSIAAFNPYWQYTRMRCTGYVCHSRSKSTKRRTAGARSFWEQDDIPARLQQSSDSVNTITHVITATNQADAVCPHHVRTQC